MRCATTLCLSAGLILGAQAAGTSVALAAHLPNFTPSFPIQHQTDARFAEQPAEPYAMNYTDEAARSLGLVGGRADFFDTGRSRNAFVPSLKGGLDRGGAMLRLQWHPGE